MSLLPIIVSNPYAHNGLKGPNNSDLGGSIGMNEMKNKKQKSTKIPAVPNCPH